MKGIIERFALVLHWLGFIATLLILLLFVTNKSSMDIYLQVIVCLFPNTIGWLVNYIFTGRNKFFPI
tara:strand:- start:497 stop:697 length:201 start_codon:yes stop_codon:yes gene_type:complete